ncbi:NADH dehydrogenase [ubiquinone] 1 alpha subcomplex subunit 8 [Nilaparvata lugens]|nr:NADH dehydrogenase [ubiquinone] 1 alpha subcomplex subunit 8 [Nilaparvata lugens]
MAVTADISLPSIEELTVDEVKLSGVPLRAAAFHLGKYCEWPNDEFMLCRNELDDPRKCISEGKAVTSCTLDFFRKVKRHCRNEFENYYHCIDRSSADYDFSVCRKTQTTFDKCMLDELNIERPDFGYFSRPKIHKAERPKPPPEQIQVFSDTPDDLPDDYPRQPTKYGTRFYFYA